MDLTRHALQTNGKYYFKFRNHVLNELHFIKIIVALGFINLSEVGEAFVQISTRSSIYIYYIYIYIHLVNV